MFWELYQQSKISDAEASASRAESKALRVNHQIRQLEDRVDSLALTCQAMWELLRERTSIGDEELMEKINEIDLRDGKVDGKMSGGKACEKCGRILNKRHARCMYCGQSVKKDHLFQ